MSDDELKREIRGYQERLPELALTFEQAAFLVENDSENRFEEARFSVWEHFDYEYEIYSRILTPGQFELFEAGWKAKRSLAIDRIRESDGEQAANLANHYGPMRRYLLDHFWPELKGVAFHEQLLLCLPRDQAKGTYLRAEYRKWEQRRRADLVTEHFRYNSRFSPLLFEAEELRLDVEKLLPPHSLFYAQADEVTKAAYDFMRRRYDSLHSNAMAELIEIACRYEAFLREKSHTSISGWHVEMEDRRTPTEKRTDWCLTVFLADVKEFFKQKTETTVPASQPNPI
ncbi:hypothetical protein [Siphonobacter aquaeclarae]|uniref:Uncharacterized protein n=1 Tax=Siphonobacter aquaeclarae TaxID=563176 RepID=A0A1G9IA02_9BACT|nr:hypothetical protein [Siphonobacter aquaeclarae]SDL22080.1 hypothetical protein SAMN04488090_0394 [Siphonobacter aquaeclarae]